jgi:hypothetical protein
MGWDILMALPLRYTSRLFLYPYESIISILYIIMVHLVRAHRMRLVPKYISSLSGVSADSCGFDTDSRVEWLFPRPHYHCVQMQELLVETSGCLPSLVALVVGKVVCCRWLVCSTILLPPMTKMATVEMKVEGIKWFMLLLVKKFGLCAR